MVLNFKTSTFLSGFFIQFLHVICTTKSSFIKNNPPGNVKYSTDLLKKTFMDYLWKKSPMKCGSTMTTLTRSSIYCANNVHSLQCFASKKNLVPHYTIISSTASSTRSLHSIPSLNLRTTVPTTASHQSKRPLPLVSMTSLRLVHFPSHTILLHALWITKGLKNYFVRSLNDIASYKLVVQLTS